VWDAEEVYSEVESCCRALSERLDNSAYFFGSKPTELGKSPFQLFVNFVKLRLRHTCWFSQTAEQIDERSNTVRACTDWMIIPILSVARILGQKDFGSRIRIRIKEFKYF
jgi:hypothetical protein